MNRSFYTRWAQKIWMPIQFAALIAAVFTPLWMNLDSRLRPELLRSSIAQNMKLEKPTSITSRIVLLPTPREAPKKLEVSIETKQLRFQSKSPIARASLNRNPSSLEWSLSKIARKTSDGEWEKLNLVTADGVQNFGSSFLELDDGVNEFEVFFKDARGKETSYQIFVSYQKSQNT